MALLAIVMCANFTACSDDDEETSSSIVGKWKETLTEISYTDENGEFHKENESGENCYIVFSEDGTALFYEARENGEPGSDRQNFTWKIEGKRLIMKDLETNEIIDATINELNSTTLKITAEDDDDTDGYIDEKVVSTYTRQ